MEESPLRRLYVDWTACRTVLISQVSPDWFQESEDFSKEFLIDLAYAQYALRTGTKALIKNFRSVCEDYYVKSLIAIPEASGSVSIKMEQR